MQRVASPKPSTVRARATRARRRGGLRMVMLPIADSEIQNLAAQGYLDGAECASIEAVTKALESYIAGHLGTDH